MEANLNQVTVLAGILLANLGALIGFFVALKVDVAKLQVEFKVKMERLERDVNNLGNLYRNGKDRNGEASE